MPGTSALVHDSDMFERDIASVREDMEKEGLDWNSKATVGMVCRMNMALFARIKDLSDRIKAVDTAQKNASFRASTYTNDVFASVAERMAELEQRKAASMVYRGAFNRTSAYEAGDLVTLNDKLYVAAKSVPAGGHLRDGSEEWVKIFSKGQNHD